MDDLTLTPPSAIGTVEADMAISRFIPLTVDEVTEIRRKVGAYLDDLLSYDQNSPQFSTKQDALANIGAREIRESARQIVRFMDRPMRAMTADAVGTALTMLRDVVRRLDPARLGDLLKPRRLFGLIPVGSSRLQEYFDQYAPAQKTLSGILTNLSHGRDDLLHDNAAIKGERERLWKMIGDLERAVETAVHLDQETERRALAIEKYSPGKAQALRKGALFHARQRTKDLLSQLAVTIQGYQSLELVQQNNIELIKGIERASTTTVAALKTAMNVAQTLKLQRVVMDRVGTLNAAATKAMDAAGRSLRTGSMMTDETSDDPQVQVAALGKAFQNVMETMDVIEDYRARAQTSLRMTADALATRIAEPHSNSLRSVT